MIYVIIYLVGCVIAGAVYIKCILSETDFTVKYIPETIFYTLLSWITLITLVLLLIYASINQDKIIFKHKKK